MRSTCLPLATAFFVASVAAPTVGFADASGDSANLPDIVGVHLGMSLEQARTAFQKAYGSFSHIDQLDMRFGPGGAMKAAYLLRTSNTDAGHANGTMEVDVTLPPNAQQVWHMTRQVKQPNVNRANFLAALRQKYGKESVAISDATRGPTKDDNAIYQMYWVFDEQGRPASGEPPFINQTPFGCPLGTSQPKIPQGLPEYCAEHYVGIFVEMNNGPIIQFTQFDLIDYPLLVRNTSATIAFSQAQDRRIEQDNQQKAQQAKPAL
ncbi:MAG TPA: hypothetical protein VEK74_05335 [Burkholderiaceae bacterium]|nr:hypothetical protein [Burkholderiaceae bacterium]